MTEALAPRWRSRKTESVGITRCTRALSTFAERFDRPFQLAFQRALISDLFIELCLAPGHLVEKLKSHAPAVRLRLAPRSACVPHPACPRER